VSKPGYRRRFTLEVTLAELRAMRAAAKDARMTTSAWLRSLVRKSLTLVELQRQRREQKGDEQFRSE
jgi:hypothetical protein